MTESEAVTKLVELAARLERGEIGFEVYSYEVRTILSAVGW